MKRIIFIIFMIFFTIFIAVILFVSLICGIPENSAEAGRYLFGAIGMSVLLPSGFTAFFISTLHLSKKLEEIEKAEEVEDEEESNTADVLVNAPIPELVNALAEKQNLTPEKKERLLSYLEDM